MFHKLLIANRGEIAVRIIRACRELEISPVAVYSEADVTALHVRRADEAYLIGAAPSVESYLRIERIIDAAKRSGAEAIHPGYGFLAENAEFARAVQDAGIIFIGPSPKAMELMGSKINARACATETGAPVVPGTTEQLTSFDEAREVAARYGYPVMLKATAGGGGKGMRLVARESDLQAALSTAQAEARSAFGDSRVYLEKAIERPRHIEIQIFADAHGNCVHLGERECSIQRRHQKVAEECPSPIDDTSLRGQMGAVAVAIARKANYVGAGTIEFLVSDVTHDFYFLEMNTRLQVEHSVTEMVTGIDLVREQICVAAGEQLSFTQADVRWNGHAIECRVYAEDSEQNFMPSPGKITRLRVPSGAWVRDDGGVYEGAEVPIFYDPLISKFAVWGRTRAEAIDHLRRALDEYEVCGIKTTLPFFRRLVRDIEFINGKLDTGFIARFNERHRATEDDMSTSDDEQMRRDIAAIAAAIAHDAKRKVTSAQNSDAEPLSKWKLAGRSAIFTSHI